LIGLIALDAMRIHPAFGQLTENEQKASAGDAPTDPGPLANDLSGALAPASIQSAMRKVAQWQNVRIVDTPSQDWTFATLYVGMLSASATQERSVSRYCFESSGALPLGVGAAESPCR
jgi:unsaturated rhamnogalacturonyl hydrolase